MHILALRSSLYTAGTDIRVDILSMSLTGSLRGGEKAGEHG